VTIVAVVVGAGVALYLVPIGSAPKASPRPQFRQIPVSSKACAAVPPLNTAAAQIRGEMDFASAGVTYPSVFLEQPKRVPWVVSRARLQWELAVLKRQIELKGPAFPAPIRQQIAITNRDIVLALPTVATSRSWSDLDLETGRLWTEGVDAFGNASKLVGSQCSAELGAGNPLGPCAFPAARDSKACT
jgi:hypothetical protein